MLEFAINRFCNGEISILGCSGLDGDTSSIELGPPLLSLPELLVLLLSLLPLLVLLLPLLSASTLPLSVESS
ncbi:hypothetical protein [Ligilactobacillus salivarius]|uniref:hypothetical protein n=1 Tax=Ligilactobacillus salivarius TaxID=1624 RepID=UPI000553D47C|nr:hypothetical protein [Ligilactobacillus salivarius]